jgi:hypothetical protein
VTDTLGLLLVVLVLPASVQDRDGARKLLLELRHRQLMSRAAGRVRHLFADGGFAGALIDWASALLRTTIEVVRKPPGQKGFAVIPDGGRSSAPSPGSPATDAWPVTTNVTRPPLRRSSAGPPSTPRPAASPEEHPLHDPDLASSLPHKDLKHALRVTSQSTCSGGLKRIYPISTPSGMPVSSCPDATARAAAAAAAAAVFTFFDSRYRRAADRTASSGHRNDVATPAIQG